VRRRDQHEAETPYEETAGDRGQALPWLSADVELTLLSESIHHIQTAIVGTRRSPLRVSGNPPPQI
jgi:hypothetical protein